jgi:hypothetical protein
VLGRAESAPKMRSAPAPDEPAMAAEFGRTPAVDRRGHLFVITGASQRR